MVPTINELLEGNPYPGRGIILGRSEDGERSVAVYFIMGRSENSRNRVFETTRDGIRTRAQDPAKLTDPSLVIYHPIRVVGEYLIVTNGDQTDTIHDDFVNTHGGKGAAHGGFRRALRTRRFEPDAPIYTPRISGVIEPNGSYTLSILKSAADINAPADGGEPACYRHFYEYNEPVNGVGHFIHTYSGATVNGTLESFVGEPKAVKVRVAHSLETYANQIWNALDHDNRISLYAREYGPAGAQEVLINKY